jgi:hypothetical protein
VAAIDILKKQWHDEARSQPFRPYLYIDDKGLLLGAGTLLVPMVKDRTGAPILAIDGNEARILATLSLGYRRRIQVKALKFIKRASMQWAKGERAIAHFELAYAQLPRFETHDEARSLFYADGFIKSGVSPRALMLAHGLDTGELDLLKYAVDEPRVPAGTPDGGQWTTGGGSTATSRLADAGEDSTSSQPGHVTNGTQSGVQVATDSGRSGYPIDLREEEQRGGHAIGSHVGKSQEYLLSDVRDIAASVKSQGNLISGLREGSFTSLEAANKLVNATVSEDENQTKVDLVVQGLSPREELDAVFTSPTGYEAYAATERTAPYIRDTYGVRVVIVRDPSFAKGYRVVTAFPRNFDR